MSVPSSTPRAHSDSARLLRKIWRAMSPADRTAAVRAAGKSNPAAVQGVRLAVIQALRMRPATVQSWPPQQLAETSAKLALDDDLIAELLVALHLTDRVPLLTAFLDAAGVPHTEGVTEDTSVSDALEPPRVLAAADQVLQQFAPEACQLYFATLVALEGGGWEPLRERLDPELLA